MKLKNYESIYDIQYQPEIHVQHGKYHFPLQSRSNPISLQRMQKHQEIAHFVGSQLIEVRMMKMIQMKIDESDSHLEKHDEPRILIVRGISID
jgi:hypothetical protein